MRSIDIGTKTTSTVVSEALYTFATEDLTLAIPCSVTDVSKYESEQLVSLQPLINDVYEDGIMITPREIKDVFVKLSSGGGFSIKLPVAAGDLFTLHYTHRDLGNYISGDGSSVSVPLNLEGRNFYCTHGFGTKSNNQSPSQTNMIISGEQATFTIEPSGKVTIIATDYIVDSPTTTFTGNVNIQGTTTCPTIEAGNSLKVDGAEVKAHTHNNQVPPLS